jgi:hypothetical protein
VVSFTLLPLYPWGKSPQCPLDWTPEPVWTIRRRENYLTFTIYKLKKYKYILLVKNV